MKDIKLNIDFNKPYRVNFTLNPKNDFDLDVIRAIEVLKEDGYNISARLKKLILMDAEGIQPVHRTTTAPAEVQATAPVNNIQEQSSNDNNNGEEDDDDDFDISAIIGNDEE